MKIPANLSLRSIAIVAISCLSVALGGSTMLWAQAVIVLLAAILILVFPPRVALGGVPTLVLILFLALAFSAFLPASWGAMPEWRRHLTEDLHAPLGDLRTPQPWLTFQACGLLVFGLVWTYYLFAQEWTPAEKTQAMRLLAAGIICLAAVSIVAYLTGYRVPGWNQEQNRGWFPNRNQTADVLALTGILTYAVAFKSFEKRQWTGIPWLAGLAVICVALVISYSRAGIIMFFTGIALWHLGSLFHPRQGKKMALSVAALLVLFSLFLLFGGPTLERFLKIAPSDHPHAEDYRILLQEDALRVSLHSPFLGVGLGNFEPVFTSMREISADQNRALHPESDWLWMAVEMGWIAPLLIVIGVAWWLRQCLPFARRAGESLRRVAMVCAFMFIAHGFVDVSGHRLGSLFVGLFLASLALSPAATKSARPWIAPLFRVTALILVLMGGWWLASCFADVGPSTTATLARLQERINVDSAEGRIASVGDEANAALGIAPLDWTNYFHRASAEAFRNGGTEQAATDFKIVRFLDPNWVDLCIEEGDVWLGVDEPEHCLDAWSEALRRAGPKGPAIFESMLRLSLANPDVHAGLEKIAATNVDYLVVFLAFASPDEAASELDGLLGRDPDLSTLSFDEQKKLFAAWYAHGDQESLARNLQAHDEWQAAGWSFLARHFADSQNFQLASVTAMKYLPAPVIQPIATDQSISVLASQFDDHSDDVIAGITLYQKQVEADQIDDALATIARLEKLKNCPRSIFYFEAELEIKQQQWEAAWNALQKYSELDQNNSP